MDRKVHIVKQDDQLVLNRIISEKEVSAIIEHFTDSLCSTGCISNKKDSTFILKGVKTQTHTFPLSSLKGFVSEASNLMILRILARQKSVTENMTFLSFDADTALSKSVYVSTGR